MLLMLDDLKYDHKIYNQFLKCFTGPLPRKILHYVDKVAEIPTITKIGFAVPRRWPLHADRVT